MSDRLTDDDLAAMEAKYEQWSPRWMKLLPESVALIAEVRWLRAELDKPADVLNDHDAVTQEDEELWERSPGDALAKAIYELLLDLNDAINAGIEVGRLHDRATHTLIGDNHE